MKHKLLKSRLENVLTKRGLKKSSLYKKCKGFKDDEAELQFTAEALRNYIYGRRPIPDNHLIELAKLLNICPDYLIGENDIHIPDGDTSFETDENGIIMLSYQQYQLKSIPRQAEQEYENSKNSIIELCIKRYTYLSMTDEKHEARLALLSDVVNENTFITLDSLKHYIFGHIDKAFDDLIAINNTAQGE